MRRKDQKYSQVTDILTPIRVEDEEATRVEPFLDYLPSTYYIVFGSHSISYLQYLLID